MTQRMKLFIELIYTTKSKQAERLYQRMLLKEIERKKALAHEGQSA